MSNTYIVRGIDENSYVTSLEHRVGRDTNNDKILSK